MTDPTRPAPLVPAEVDLRDTPMPASTLVDMACSEFGMSRDEAWAAVREWARVSGFEISGLHG